MKILFIILFPFLLATTALTQKKISNISDMVLIYHGGTQCLAWTTDQLKPYLYRKNSGKIEWPFDGFLFLEIFDNIKKYDYDPGFGYKTAGKEQWEWLLNRYFSQQKGPDALETLLDSLSRKGKKPLRKRQVVLSIPCPVARYTEWGELDGKSLNFNNPGDQAQAARWFIDEALKKWKEKNYKHLQMNSFYWVHETADQSDEAISYVKNSSMQKTLIFFGFHIRVLKVKENGKNLDLILRGNSPTIFSQPIFQNNG